MKKILMTLSFMGMMALMGSGMINPVQATETHPQQVMPSQPGNNGAMSEAEKEKKCKMDCSGLSTPENRTCIRRCRPDGKKSY